MAQLTIEINGGIFDIKIAQIPLIDAAEAIGAAQAGLNQVIFNLAEQAGHEHSQDVFRHWVDLARQRASRLNSAAGRIEQLIE